MYFIFWLCDITQCGQTNSDNYEHSSLQRSEWHHQQQNPYMQGTGIL